MFTLLVCISYSFCWICLRTDEEHNGNWNCAAFPVPAADSSSTELTPILQLNLWEAGNEALEKAKSKLQDLEEKIIPKLEETCGLSKLDIRTVREAGMLIVQCRQILKWSFVFDFFVTENESTKKQYLKHRRDQAISMLCTHEGTLHELMNQALLKEDFTCFKHLLETSTTITGNYFDGFVKNLEEGMPEVKTEEDGPSNHWFCDRCTFENSWVDKQCKMCFFPVDSPPPPPHVAAPEDLGKLGGE